MAAIVSFALSAEEGSPERHDEHVFHATVGDNVTVRFRVADQDHVDVPVALEDAVTANAEATAVWDELTPGKRRALAHHVRSAKTGKTRSKRVAEAMAALVNNGGKLR